MANAHIGTVYIKVSPDSKDFRKDVEKQIGKEPLKQKLDVEVDKSNVSEQVSDALDGVASGKHKFKIQPEMDDALKAIDGLNRELDALQRTHEIKFDLNKDSIVEEIDKLWDTLDGKSKDRFTATVEVIPDEDGYRQALRRIEQIRRQRIKPIEIPIGLTDEEIDAFEKEMEKKLADAMANRPPETVNLSVDLDYDGLQSAIDEVDRRLKALQAVDIEVELDEDKLKELRGDLVDLQEHSQLRITYSHDEAGYRSVIRKIDEILNKDNTFTVDFDTDESSLRAVRDRMDQALSWEPIMVTYDDDRAGRESLIKRIQDELKRRALELEFNLNVSDGELRRKLKEVQDATPVELKVQYIDDRAGREGFIKRIQDELKRRALEVEFDLNVSDGELRRKLKEMQDATPVQLKVQYLDDIEGRGGMIDKIQEELYRRNFEAEVDLKADDSELMATISRLERLNARDRNINFTPRVNPLGLALAELQLTAATRDRWVNIKPRIIGSLTRDLQGAFMAIAGLNSIRTLVDTIRDIALNFDEWAISVGTVSAAVGTLVSVATVGLGAVLSIAKDTLQVFQGFAMVPTFLLSGAAALQTWHAIWNDFGDAIGGDSDALARIPANGKRAVAAIQELDTAVNRTIQNNFWGEMTDEVERFTERIGPHIVKVMGGTAKIWGTTISGMLDSTERLAKDGSLDRFTKNHLEGMTHLGAAAETVFDTLMKMGIHGSKYLPQLGAWVRELSSDFDEFMTRSIEDGSFDRWIENSVKSMESLARTAKHSFGILGGVLRAFEAQGGAGLHEMADGLERIDHWVNQAGTQARLENIFASAMEGAGAAGQGFADLSKAIWEYEAVLSRALVVTGQLAGEFMTQISKVDPTVMFQGFFDMMDGLRDFVHLAGPGFESIANIFGRLGSIGGEVAREIAHGMNLTMGAIDGFIARIQGPLIAAIHPLTRVFEDVAAAATPALFGIANSVGLLLTAFSKLPAPIQNTITLMALLNRTGIMAGAISAVKRFNTQLAFSQRTVTAFGGHIEGTFARSAARVGVSARVMGRAALAAFGGPWGIAITAAIGGITALAGAHAKAEADVRALADAFRDGGDAALRTEVYRQMEDALLDFSKAGGDANLVLDEIMAGRGDAVIVELREMQNAMRDVSSYLDPALEGFEQYEDAYKKAFGSTDGIKLSQEQFEKWGITGYEAVTVLINALNGVPDAVERAKDLGMLDGEIDDTRTAAEKLNDVMEDSPRHAKDTADALREVGEAAGDGASQVDVLRDALRLMSGTDLTLNEVKRAGIEAAEDVKAAVKRINETDGWDWGAFFTDEGFSIPDTVEGLEVMDLTEHMMTKMAADIQENKIKLDSEAFDYDMSDWNSYMAGMSEELTAYAQEVGEDFRWEQEKIDAFAEALHQEFNITPVNVETTFNGGNAEDVLEDIEKLRAMGVKVDEDEYVASVELDDNGFVHGADRVEAIGNALNDWVVETEFDANSANYDSKVAEAMELGHYFDGEEFRPIFDADGQPFDAALGQLFQDGYQFDGTDFIAHADVETDVAMGNVLSMANTVGEVWVDGEWVALVDVDGTPTEEGMAAAEALGIQWDSNEWRALLDADDADVQAKIDENRAAGEEYAKQRFEAEIGLLPLTDAEKAELRELVELSDQDLITKLDVMVQNLDPAAREQLLNDVSTLEDYDGQIFQASQWLEGLPESTRGEIQGTVDDLGAFEGYYMAIQWLTGLSEAERASLNEDEDLLSQWPGWYDAELWAELNGDDIEDATEDLEEFDGTNAEASFSINDDGVTTAQFAHHRTELDEYDGTSASASVGVDGAPEASAAVRGPKQIIEDFAKRYEAALEATGGDAAAAAALVAKEGVEGFVGRYRATLEETGSGTVIERAAAAATSGSTFARLYQAIFGESGSDNVIARAGAAAGAGGAFATSYTGTIQEQGSGTVIQQARAAGAAGGDFATDYTGRILERGSTNVIAQSRATYAQAMRLVRMFRAQFGETGARGVVSQANSATSAAQNTGRQRPVVTFGGDGSGFWSVANAIARWTPPTKTVKVGVAMTGAASALIGADGALSGSQFKLQQAMVDFDPYKLFGITPFGDGGVNYMTKPGSAHIARAGQNIMYAERETGGEAFIPLHPSKRARSLAIWEETGQRLGALEGRSVGTTSEAGGDVYNIDVHEGGVSAGDILNEVTHRRRRKGRM